MAGTPVAIGVDYGTESGRVLLLDLATGAEIAAQSVAYEHGVIDHALPGGTQLGTDWALQHPADWIAVLRTGIPAALRSAGIDASRVVGLGVDFTSCTVLPARKDGTPLCLLDAFATRPHAWPKLWKHHSAQAIADRMTEVALERGEPFLRRYGGRISSEWYFPKLIEVFRDDRAVYDAADVYVEATDWIVWQLTGTLARSACAAGYKALWSAADGLPPTDYFAAVAPGFDRPAEKLGTTFARLGERAGFLRADLAEDLGLPENVAVAVGNVDSFVSVPGCGVRDTGVLVSVVGTSICDMLVDNSEVFLPGITGVVREGVLPDSFGYEAGQPAVGDMFAWYVDRLLGVRTSDRYEALEKEAALIQPGASGLVALDWWNGNRSILGDADLGGVIMGLSLHTTPVELYRSLLEAVAFGMRAIVDNFVEHKMSLDRIVACGGIAEKSPLLMQMFADVTSREVEIAGSPQVPARGAALFGAVAAGPERGGFADITTAAARLRPEPASLYRPDARVRATYDELYAIYKGMHDHLGRARVEWLHGLKALRRATARETQRAR